MRIAEDTQNIFESWRILEDFFRWNQQGHLVPHEEKIDKIIRDHDFILVNGSTEHWGIERDFPLVARIHDVLDDRGCKKFLCLSHDPTDQYLRSHILYFPYWGWRGLHDADPHYRDRLQRTWLYSNLNNRAKDFRIANYFRIRDKIYSNRCLMSLFRPGSGSIDWGLPLTEKEMQKWIDLVPVLPDDVDDGFPIVWQFDHPAFDDTYVHIVSESTIEDKIFLTEKTWQTIAAGQIFLIWGNPGIISHLRDLGVDVFDDIVDHRYDLESNHRDRLDLIHEELDKLSTNDWSMIYQKTATRRQKNSKDFFSGRFIGRFIDRLIQLCPPNSVKLPILSHAF